MTNIFTINNSADDSVYAVGVEAGQTTVFFGTSQPAKVWAKQSNAKKLKYENVVDGLGLRLYVGKKQRVNRELPDRIAANLDGEDVEKIINIITRNNSQVLKKSLDIGIAIQSIKSSQNNDDKKDKESEEEQRPVSLTETPISYVDVQLKQDAIIYKAKAFRLDSQISSMALEAKGLRAIWDPNARGNIGAWRCPDDTPNGGQFTNRFGRGCTLGVSRRIGRAFISAARRADSPAARLGETLVRRGDNALLRAGVSAIAAENRRQARRTAAYLKDTPEAEEILYLGEFAPSLALNDASTLVKGNSINRRARKIANRKKNRTDLKQNSDIALHLLDINDKNSKLSKRLTDLGAIALVHIGPDGEPVVWTKFNIQKNALSGDKSPDVATMRDLLDDYAQGKIDEDALDVLLNHLSTTNTEKTDSADIQAIVASFSNRNAGFLSGAVIPVDPQTGDFEAHNYVIVALSPEEAQLWNALSPSELTSALSNRRMYRTLVENTKKNKPYGLSGDDVAKEAEKLLKRRKAAKRKITGSKPMTPQIAQELMDAELDAYKAFGIRRTSRKIKGRKPSGNETRIERAARFLSEMGERAMGTFEKPAKIEDIKYRKKTRITARAAKRGLIMGTRGTLKSFPKLRQRTTDMPDMATLSRPDQDKIKNAVRRAHADLTKKWSRKIGITRWINEDLGNSVDPNMPMTVAEIDEYLKNHAPNALNPMDVGKAITDAHNFQVLQEIIDENDYSKIDELKPSLKRAILAQIGIEPTKKPAVTRRVGKRSTGSSLTPAPTAPSPAPTAPSAPAVPAAPAAPAPTPSPPTPPSRPTPPAPTPSAPTPPSRPTPPAPTPSVPTTTPETADVTPPAKREIKDVPGVLPEGSQYFGVDVSGLVPMYKIGENQIFYDPNTDDIVDISEQITVESIADEIPTVEFPKVSKTPKIEYPKIRVLNPRTGKNEDRHIVPGVSDKSIDDLNYTLTRYDPEVSDFSELQSGFQTTGTYLSRLFKSLNLDNPDEELDFDNPNHATILGLNPGVTGAQLRPGEALKPLKQGIESLRFTRDEFSTTENDEITNSDRAARDAFDSLNAGRLHKQNPDGTIVPASINELLLQIFGSDILDYPLYASPLLDMNIHEQRLNPEYAYKSSRSSRGYWSRQFGRLSRRGAKRWGFYNSGTFGLDAEVVHSLFAWKFTGDDRWLVDAHEKVVEYTAALKRDIESAINSYQAPGYKFSARQKRDLVSRLYQLDAIQRMTEKYMSGAQDALVRVATNKKRSRYRGAFQAIKQQRERFKRRQQGQVRVGGKLAPEELVPKEGIVRAPDEIAETVKKHASDHLFSIDFGPLKPEDTEIESVLTDEEIDYLLAISRSYTDSTLLDGTEVNWAGSYNNTTAELNTAMELNGYNDLPVKVSPEEAADMVKNPGETKWFVASRYVNRNPNKPDVTTSQMVEEWLGGTRWPVGGGGSAGGRGDNFAGGLGFSSYGDSAVVILIPSTAKIGYRQDLYEIKSRVRAAVAQLQIDGVDMMNDEQLAKAVDEKIDSAIMGFQNYLGDTRPVALAQGIAAIRKLLSQYQQIQMLKVKNPKTQREKDANAALDTVLKNIAASDEAKIALLLGLDGYFSSSTPSDDWTDGYDHTLSNEQIMILNRTGFAAIDKPMSGQDLLAWLSGLGGK